MEVKAIPGEFSGPQPFITVAICTRNRARFLWEAVESVLRQMQPGVELLIVDNGSTDETPTLLRKLCRKNRFVRVHVEEESGVSRARNAALRRARGKYVLFLDDDDIADDGWLAAYASFFKNLPGSKLAGAGGAVIPRFEALVPFWLPAGSHTLNWSEKSQPFKAVGGPWNCNLALDREVALAVGGYDQELGRNGKSMAAHEESALFDKIRTAGYEFWWLPQARIRYRVHGDRMRFLFTSRSEFAAGKSAAIYKAFLRPAGFQRWGWGVCRLMGVPCQILGGALVALFFLPFRPVPRAASVWFRACRNVGFALGLCKLLTTKK